MTWQTQTRAWLEKRRIENFSDEIILFFENAFQTPLKLYPRDAWFGIHGEYASLTIGNMWLAAIGTQPRCAYLIVERDLKMRGMGYLPIPSTFKYVPLGFLTVKEWGKLGALNQNKRVWDSYDPLDEFLDDFPTVTREQAIGVLDLVNQKSEIKHQK